MSSKSIILKSWKFAFNLILLLLVVSFVALLVGFSWIKQDLPPVDQITEINLPLATLIYDSQGNVISKIARENRIYVSHEDIPDKVIFAFVSAEDKNFYKHGGIDFVSLARAIMRNISYIASGRRFHGASTITQQTVKIFLLSGERSLTRKIREAILALELEKKLSKDKIIELYLNEIYLGERSYGIAAAARTYFNKTLKQLTYAEAAYLAALPKAPNNYHPIKDKEKAVQRRNYVLREMYQNGYISEEEFENAISETEIRTVLNEKEEEKVSINAAYFIDDVIADVAGMYDYPSVYSGGLTVHTTLDPELQEVANAVLRKHLIIYQKRHGYTGPISNISTEDGGVNEKLIMENLKEFQQSKGISAWNLAVVLSFGDYGAEVIVDTNDAEKRGYIPMKDLLSWKLQKEVTVSVKNKDNRKKETQLKVVKKAFAIKKPSDLLSVGDVILVEYDKSSKEGELWKLMQIPEVNGGFAAIEVVTGRVLTMVGGISHKLSPFNRSTQALRQPGSAFKPIVYAAALDNGYTPLTVIPDLPVTVKQNGQQQTWKPKNSGDRFYGESTLRTGLEKSRNILTIRIAQDVGIGKIAKYAESLHIYDDMPHLLSYAIGAGETTLLNLISAYASFANGGVYTKPYSIERIQDNNGTTIYRHADYDCEFCSLDDLDGLQHKLPTPPKFPGEKKIDEITAYQIVNLLQGVIKRGTAKSIRYLDFPVAGKTGTTNESRDAWFIGFTPNVTAGCFVGYDSPTPLGKSEGGGKICAPMFAEFMEAAMEKFPKLQFKVPSNARFAKANHNTGELLPPKSDYPSAIIEVFRVNQIPSYYMVNPDALKKNEEEKSDDNLPSENENYPSQSDELTRPPSIVPDYSHDEKIDLGTGLY